MDIKNAKYEISCPTVSKCPESNIPEYAFIGRSNVGKSSLINMLCKSKKMAKTSQTPGKTLLINYFSMDDGAWYLVDLPGYGFARRGKDQRDALTAMIKGYAQHRAQLTCLFVLLDIRHSPQKIDLEFMEWLGENQIPFAIIFTKSDKIGPMVALRNVDDYSKVLLKSWEELPPIFITSSEKGKGREEIIEYLYSINESLAGEGK
jgi:GTP-binding protein